NVSSGDSNTQTSPRLIRNTCVSEAATPVIDHAGTKVSPSIDHPPSTALPRPVVFIAPTYGKMGRPVESVACASTAVAFCPIRAAVGEANRLNGYFASCPRMPAIAAGGVPLEPTNVAACAPEGTNPEVIVPPVPAAPLSIVYTLPSVCRL